MEHLKNKSLVELKTLHKTLTTYTKKQSTKTKIIESINGLFKAFDDNIKPSVTRHVKEDIEKLSAVDLRQVHQKFRQTLHLKKINKTNIVQSLINLCKEIDFFIQY